MKWIIPAIVVDPTSRLGRKNSIPYLSLGAQSQDARVATTKSQTSSPFCCVKNVIAFIRFWRVRSSRMNNPRVPHPCGFCKGGDFRMRSSVLISSVDMSQNPHPLKITKDGDPKPSHPENSVNIQAVRELLRILVNFGDLVPFKAHKYRFGRRRSIN